MPAPTPLASRRREISAETSGADGLLRAGQVVTDRPRAGRPLADRLHAGRPYRRGFWLVGFVFLVTMAFSAGRG